MDVSTPRPMTDLQSFSILSFDCYGTLIDWETGIWAALQPLLAHNRARVGRVEALEAFAEIESAQQASTPGLRYPEVLAEVHRAFARRFGLQARSGMDRAFGASVEDWPPFDDSIEALGRLATRYELVILSNVDRTSFAASARRLETTFLAVYTAEDLGAYKPSLGNFRSMIEDLASRHGVERESILHVAQSLFHDHVPATRVGLATAWIDRQDLAGGGAWGATAHVPEWPTVDFTFPDLASLAAAAGV